MPLLTPKKTLLSPQFEGYKLDAIDQDEVLTRFSLEHPLTQSSSAGKSPLSFQEVQSRIRHNHLAVGPEGVAAYVDAEMAVIKVKLVPTNNQPSFDVLYEMPRQLQSSDTDGPHREYPSVAFADESTLLASDGNGILYILQLGETGPATLYNFYELNVPESHRSAFTTAPFRIHHARRSGPDSCMALLSSRYYSSEDVPTVSTKGRKPKSAYDLWAVDIDLTQLSQDQPLTLDVRWHRRGEDVPSYVSYLDSKDAYLLLGSSPYRSLVALEPSTYEPTPDEMAPIPRAEESLDAPQGASKPPPYSWTQTTDSVTVAFALPSNTLKDAMKVNLSATTLTLLVQSNDTDGTASQIPLPRYALKKFWAGIRTPTSFWTFDREAEHTFGLLTLHLDKQHEGTRWPQLFAQVPDDTEPEVPETIDPSELWHIRESLEKYTAALQTGEDASGLGLGSGVPSLAEGEMDDEVDLDTGDTVTTTWVGADGSVPPWSAEKGSDPPFSILATPLPNTSTRAPSLVVKHGMDGLVYDFVETATGEDQEWQHTGTYCVLAFVLASKRDTRFVHHVSSRTVFAFESGARGLGSNIYIYRGVARPKDKHAKQAVLKAGNSSSGPLLGVGMVPTGGESVLLCLCEKEIAVIRNTL